MSEKEILEEYKFLLEEYHKIDYEKNKKFCIQNIGLGVGSLVLEIITNLEIFAPLFLGGVIYFGTKNILDLEEFYYPIINHSVYKEILTKYQICNKKIASAISNIEEKDPAFVAGIYQNLLSKGFFSYNGKCNNNQKSSLPLPLENLGIYVINGNYQNKYIAIHFKDILDELGFKNTILPVYFNKTIFENLNETKWYGYKILNELEKSDSSIIDNFFDKQIAKFFGNRLLNICKLNNNAEIYYIDIMNGTFYQKRNFKTLELPNLLQLKEQKRKVQNYSIPIRLSSSNFYYTKENKKIAKELLSHDTIINDLKTQKNIYSSGQKYVEQNIKIFESLYQENLNNFIEINNYFSKLENTIQTYKEEQRNKVKIKTRK